MSNANQDQTASFASYGKPFQEKIMQALLVDQKWAEQMLEVFDVNYFDLKYLVFLSERYFKYAQRYKVFPTMQLLVTIIRDELKEGNDRLLKDQVVNYLTRMKANPNPGDLEFVKDKALDFCRKQSLKNALEDVVDSIASSKYEQCIEIVKKAVMVGTTPSVGHDFQEDQDARFTLLDRQAVPTGIAELDRKEILNGGLGKGELGVVTAPTGVGKSHFLTAMGANAMKQGINVLHYTLELSETAVGVRYDSNLCEIDSSDVVENKDKVLDMYKNSELGRLFIKHYPMNTPTVHTLKSHIERLAVTKNFKPGLICLDYADIMRSSRQFDSLRHELKLVYEELRCFAEEIGVPIWTASQSNKEGSSADIVDLSNMSEAYGKAMVADLVLGLSRKPQEKSSGQGRIFVAKNRAGRDGLLYPIHIDTAQSRFTISGEEGSLGEARQSDEQEIKKAVLEKWKDVKKDKALKERSQEVTSTDETIVESE